MAHTYKLVQWTPYKRSFDFWLAVGIAGFLGSFVVVSHLTFGAGQSMSDMQILIRAFGSCAFGLLHLILIIGPAARLSPRFIPILYNRRHMGVACFMLALVHGALVTLWYHGFSDLNPLVSLLVSNPRYGSIGGFPFESLGLIALFVLFVMAATSHDFWNARLGPSIWKTLHMGVYFAYALLVAHVMLGAIQYEKSPLFAAMVAAGGVIVVGLHMLTGAGEWRRDRAGIAPRDGWLEVGRAVDMVDNRARIVVPAHGERIAVFRYGNKISAVSNVCRHQGGPLGEGRIVDGCITCPWHGFQYLPETGTSPPPYTEKIATYRIRITGGVVFVHEKAMKPGTAVSPSLITP